MPGGFVVLGDIQSKTGFGIFLSFAQLTCCQCKVAIASANASSLSASGGEVWRIRRQGGFLRPAFPFLLNYPPTQLLHLEFLNNTVPLSAQTTHPATPPRYTR